MNLHRPSFSLILLCINLFISNGDNLTVENILGGYKVREYTFTYQVLIRKKYLFPSDYRVLCGGALIDAKFVLTGAHGFINEFGYFNNALYEVLGGSNNIIDPRAIVVDVDAIYTPTDYNYFTYENDIAVLKLNRGLDIISNPRLSILTLPRFGVYLGEAIVISGYGYNEMNVFFDNTSQAHVWGKGNGLLSYAHVSVINKNECQKRTKNRVFDTQFCGCTVVPNERMEWGPCLGDSGGPLVFNNTVIIGIMSNTPINCVDTYFPSKYTKVWPFVDFIQNVLRGTPLSNTIVFMKNS